MTLTINEAMKRHKGISRRQFQNMLLRGFLKGKKVMGRWHIPISELDRVIWRVT